MCSLRQIHKIEGEIQSGKYFVLQVTCPSLLADRNQIYTNSSACAVSDRCGVLERSMKQKAGYRGESILFFQ
jgi:hypothetical protein